MAKFLKNPICYQGSKSKELHHIDNNKPTEFKKFIDVFGGGGVVALYFLQKYPELDEIVYNDMDKTMVDLFTILKDSTKTDELVEWVGSQNYDESEWIDRAKKYKNSNKDDIRERLYIKRLAFRGLESSTMPLKRKNKNGELVLRPLKNYPEFYKYPPILNTDKFKITMMDALEVIELYKDDENALLYLDPPYISSNTTSYIKFDGDDVKKLLDIVKDKSYKCKIMLHIEFLGYTYHALKEHIIFYYPKRYGLSSKAKGKDIYQKYIMIAGNY
jgi:site-specific DNA-adenine methylase